MASSGGLVRSRPATRSIAGTTPRMTIGPTQNQTPQPVRAHMPKAMNASDGTTSPMSQR